MKKSEQNQNDSVEIIEWVEDDEPYEQDNQELQQKHPERKRSQRVDFSESDQLQSLNIYQDPEMENVIIDIQHSKIQYDWLIFEQHTYEINTTLNCKSNIIRSVTRRFSDFEWLYQELVFKYPGYVLPALPEKGLYSKLDPKIPYLNKIKSEFMEQRKEMLNLFLIGLTNHRELKYARELKIFLANPDSVIHHHSQKLDSILFETNCLSFISIIIT